MKAIVYYGRDDVRLEEIIKPTVSAGEILLKVKACSICGTDLRIIRSGHHAVTPPRVLGHEISGTIEEVGDGVQGYRLGDSVIVVTPVGCRQCKFCFKNAQNMCPTVSRTVHSLGYYCDGGFAEYMLIPRDAVANQNLIPFTPTISYEEASLTEPLSCVINGQQFLHIEEGDCVAIFGAGPIGCMHASLARTRRAGKIIMIDVAQSKLETVKKLNTADVYLLASDAQFYQRIDAETSGAGVDVAITACPSPTAQEQAIAITGIRGRISFFGGIPKDNPYIRLNSNDIHYGEKALYGAFASSHPQYRQALQLITSRTLDVRPLIHQTFPLEDFFKALDVIKRGEVLKIIITPS